ncbi:hypothetical protein TNCV_4234261 [Trichonephila clavipes]|nr:hypothetical protein TNCV_4234261 [Trichonephila clavipes]
MILSGDFNINFADDKNLSLIEFLNETLGLTMSNDRKVSTTNWDEKMNGDCKAKLADGTVVGFEAGASLFTDPISDVVKCI